MEHWRGQGLLCKTTEQWEQLQQSSEYAAATTTVLRNGTISIFDDGVSYTVYAAAWATLTATVADAATGSSGSVLVTRVSSNAPATTPSIDCGGIVIAAWAALIITVADVDTRSSAANLTTVGSPYALATASINSDGIVMVP